MEPNALRLDVEMIRDVCRRHRVAELHLFGSTLRDDFRAGSDVDFLLRPAPGHRLTFSELLKIEDELSDVCGRSVDIVLRTEIDGPDANPTRKREILATMVPIYGAG